MPPAAALAPNAGLPSFISPLLGESLVLDTTGCDHLFGGEEGLLPRIVNDFHERGLNARAAVADTWGAAWAAAHFVRAATVVITPGKQSEVLAPLPVQALRLPAEIVETLRELDLRTIGQLLALPRNSLRRRFGSVLLERIDQATGRMPEWIIFEPPPQRVIATWGFEHPVSDRAWICHVLRRLVDDVAAQLAERSLGTTELECRFLHAQESRTILVGLVRPTLCAARLWGLLDLKLERIIFSEAVSVIHVEAAALQPLRERQGSLIDAPGDWDEAAELIERLTSRLGERAVLRPELVDDHQPELAFRLLPAIRQGRLASNSKESLSVQRPLYVPRQPCRVSAVALVPDGPPIRFQWQGGDHVIVRSWGPERIETGWWRKEHIRRDYYRVETNEWRQFWLFRDRSSGEWFLHGSFD